MQIMICLRGDDEQLPYLKEIMELGSGIELGSYGLIGVQSEKEWNHRYQQHKKVVENFHGKIALHGPFLGMDYIQVDHIIRNAIQKRLDMIFETARQLNAFRVVLHGGFRSEYELFKLEESWLASSCEYWRLEIIRWENATISVVLENDIDKSPGLLMRLVDSVNSPYLGLCLDVGHLNVFSSSDPATWTKAWAARLEHVHLHDNDGEIDQHWPIGKGSIDFDSFFMALEKYAPHPTLSLEVNDEMDVKMNELRTLAKRYLG